MRKAAKVAFVEMAEIAFDAFFESKTAFDAFWEKPVFKLKSLPRGVALPLSSFDFRERSPQRSFPQKTSPSFGLQTRRK